MYLWINHITEHNNERKFVLIVELPEINYIVIKKFYFLYIIVGILTNKIDWIYFYRN